MSRKRESPAAAAGLPKLELAFRTGFQTVVVLGVAAKEGASTLSDGQYLHIKDLVKQLRWIRSERIRITAAAY